MKKKKVSITPYFLVGIPMIPVIMFSFYPFVKTIISTFSVTTEYGKFIKFIGLKNWIRMFTNREFIEMIIRTLKFSGMCLVISFFIAMLFALLTANKGKSSRVHQTLFGMPMIIASAPIAAIWRFVFRQNGGILNSVLGTNVAWLSDTGIVLLIVAVVSSWGHIATNYLYLLVGFRNVSDDLIEASKIDGAGWWTRTMKIMIPMASPQIFYVLFLNIIWSFKVFAQIKLLTGGGPANATNTLIVSIYNRGVVAGQFEYACCEAITLFLFIFVATRIQFAAEKKFVHYQ